MCNCHCAVCYLGINTIEFIQMPVVRRCAPSQCQHSGHTGRGHDRQRGDICGLGAGAQTQGEARPQGSAACLQHSGWASDPIGLSAGGWPHPSKWRVALGTRP